MLLTFFEWLKNKNLDEGVGRLAQMTHEELPDIAPEAGQIVIMMDKPKAIITNNDLYYVLFKNDNEVVLVPKAVIDRSNPSIGQQLKIPRNMWKDFTLINHLLTRKEKFEKFSSKPVWIIGASKDRWIANREAELRRQSRMKSPGVTTPAEIEPYKLAQLRQQFTTREEEPEVSAARSWLRGG
jgi:hypothetical protein